jgi:hypothetical protein
MRWRFRTVGIIIMLRVCSSGESQFHEEVWKEMCADEMTGSIQHSMTRSARSRGHS